MSLIPSIPPEQYARLTYTERTAHMTSTARDYSEIITVRRSRTAAERYIRRYANVLGETDYWNGSRNVPIRLEWEVAHEAGTRDWWVIAHVTHLRD